jgi:DNA repair protein RadC
MPDYELLEIVIFAAISPGDVKPLAKRLLKRFGGFADAITSPPDILQKWRAWEKLLWPHSRSLRLRHSAKVRKAF